MKAVIPAAGHGTRFYPVSKTIPKEMLPVLDRPAIQWIVEEALEAGADEVIVVTSPEKPALKQYFTPDARLLRRLAGKPEAEATLRRLDALSARVRFVEQHEQLGLGHALLQAAPALRGETDPVLVLLGDCLVSGNAPCARGLVEISRALGGASVIGLERVARDRLSRYGIVGAEPTERERLYRLTELVEKPDPGRAPSDLAIAGRYLLDVRIFDLLAEQQAGLGGEIQLTDAIQKLLPLAPVYGYRYPGQRHDIGNPGDYLATVLSYAQAAQAKRPDGEYGHVSP